MTILRTYVTNHTHTHTHTQHNSKPMFSFMKLTWPSLKVKRVNSARLNSIAKKSLDLNTFRSLTVQNLMLRHCWRVPRCFYGVDKELLVSFSMLLRCIDVYWSKWKEPMRISIIVWSLYNSSPFFKSKSSWFFEAVLLSGRWKLQFVH